MFERGRRWVKFLVGFAAASGFGTLLVTAVWGWINHENMAGHVGAYWSQPLTNNDYGLIVLVMALGLAAGVAALL
jgi:hypothetical protein